MSCTKCQLSLEGNLLDIDRLSINVDNFFSYTKTGREAVLSFFYDRENKGESDSNLNMTYLQFFIELIECCGVGLWLLHSKTFITFTFVY